MDDGFIPPPIYDPRLPWWVSVLGALGCVLCVLVLVWAIKLLVVG